MKDQLVSLEVAKLLKEKGFVNLSDKSYILSEGVRYGMLSNFTNKCNNSVEEDRIEAPTQSLAQKWLREKYEIHVQIDFSYSSPLDVIWYANIYVLKAEEVYQAENGKGYSTYEEALEEGLRVGLDLIK